MISPFAMSATAAAAWAALTLVLLLICLVVGVVVMLARFWRQVGPSVRPTLEAFGLGLPPRR